MANLRCSAADHALAMKAIGDDPYLAEALGLVAYWGNDTSTPTGRGKPIKTLREPELYDEAEEAERMRLRGSSHATLPPLRNDYVTGFNNVWRSA